MKRKAVQFIKENKRLILVILAGILAALGYIEKDQVITIIGF